MFYYKKLYLIMLFLIFFMINSAFPASAEEVSSKLDKLFTHTHEEDNFQSVDILQAGQLLNGNFLVIGEYRESGIRNGNELFYFNSAGIVSKYLFTNGRMYFSKNERKLFYVDYDEKTLQVYTEDFKLIAEHNVRDWMPSSSTFAEQNVLIYEYENHIGFQFIPYEPQNHVNNIDYFYEKDVLKSGFIYDVKANQVLTENEFPKLPISQYEYYQSQIHLIDALGRVKMKLENPTNANIVHVGIHHNSFTIIESRRNQTFIREYNFDNNILEEKIIDHEIYIVNRSGKYMDNHEQLNLITYSEDGVFYTYNTDTNVLSEAQPTGFSAYRINKLNEELSVLVTGEGDSEVILNNSFVPLYKFFKTNIQAGFSSSVSNKFGTAMTHDYVDMIINLYTGEKLITFPNTDNAYYFIEDKFLLVYTSFTRIKRSMTMYKLPTYESFPKNKMWTITFNEEVDASSVIDKNIYVVNENNKRQAVSFSINKNEILVYAPNGNYKEGNYTLELENIKSVDGTTLNRKNIHHFSIE